MEKLLQNFLAVADEGESKLVSNSPAKHKIVAPVGRACSRNRTHQNNLSRVYLFYHFAKKRGKAFHSAVCFLIENRRKCLIPRG